MVSKFVYLPSLNVAGKWGPHDRPSHLQDNFTLPFCVDHPVTARHSHLLDPPEHLVEQTSRYGYHPIADQNFQANREK